MSRVRGLGGLARIGWRSAWVYRADAIVGILELLVRVVLFTLVWRAIYHHQGAVNGVDESTAVGYVILALITSSVLNPWPGVSIASRVRDGLIGIDLLRPFGLIEQSLAGQLGRTAAHVPQAVVAVAAGLALGGLNPPADPTAATGFLVSLLLAVIVGQLLTFIMSMSAFWMLETGGMYGIYGLATAFLSGALVPLWLLPGWLRGAAEWLPFQAVTFVPLAVYMGRPPDGLVAAIGVQVLWIAALTGLSAVLWHRARRRVVVQGG